MYVHAQSVSLPKSLIQRNIDVELLKQVELFKHTVHMKTFSWPCFCGHLRVLSIVFQLEPLCIKCNISDVSRLMTPPGPKLLLVA
jgi:hypothetical protein